VVETESHKNEAAFCTILVASQNSSIAHKNMEDDEAS